MAAVDDWQVATARADRVGHRNRDCEKNRGMRYFRANHEIVSIGAVFASLPIEHKGVKNGFLAVFVHSKSEVNFTSLLVIHSH